MGFNPSLKYSACQATLKSCNTMKQGLCGWHIYMKVNMDKIRQYEGSRKKYNPNRWIYHDVKSTLYCELFYIQVLTMVIITETLTSTSHHDIFTYLDYIFFLLPSYCRILSIFTFILSFRKKLIPNTFLHNI